MVVRYYYSRLSGRYTIMVKGFMNPMDNIDPLPSESYWIVPGTMDEELRR